MAWSADIDRDALAALCQRRHIRRLSIFGSALRDDFRPDSDIDVLVEFDEGLTPGLAFFAIQRELAELLARPVDLHTAADLNPFFRDDVLREAETQYVAA